VPDLVRTQVFLDSTGIAQEAVADSALYAVRVLALPVRLRAAGRTWTELVRLLGENPATRPIDFHIASYLPDYARKLTSDLEAALAEGKSIYLWTSEATLRLAGYPFPDGPRWTDTTRWYRTAADALEQINGIAMEQIP
jgi:hypothetical protein